MISGINIANNMKPRTVWGLMIFFVIGLPNAFPVYQLFKTNGYLFYTNAYDEYSYLSYEGSLNIQTIIQDMLNSDIKDMPAFVQKMVDEKQHNGKVIHALMAKMLSKALMGDNIAAKDMLDRTFGKATQNIEATVKTNYTDFLNGCDDE